MKLKQLTTTAVTLALFCGTALAQNLIDASKLDGKKVTNLQGEELGDLQQVLIDPQSGRVRYGVLEVNKLWKVPDPEVAVPFGALKITGKPADATFKVTLDATKDKLTKAPKHKIGEADRLYSKEAGTPIYTYWSIYWFDDTTPDKTTNEMKPSSDTTSTKTEGAGNSAGNKTDSAANTTPSTKK